jgi:hypothetical protein
MKQAVVTVQDVLYPHLVVREVPSMLLLHHVRPAY